MWQCVLPRDALMCIATDIEERPWSEVDEKNVREEMNARGTYYLYNKSLLEELRLMRLKYVVFNNSVGKRTIKTHRIFTIFYDLGHKVRSIDNCVQVLMF